MHALRGGNKQRDSRNLARSRGKEHEKSGTGKRTRRVKGAGNSAQGRGHAIKSRPGSKLGMRMTDDADAEEKQSEAHQSDARAAAKPSRNYRRTSTTGADAGKKKRVRTASADEKTATRRKKQAAKAVAETKGGRRAPGTKPGRHEGLPASTRKARTAGEASRRKRTGGGFAGVKRSATTPS